MILDLHTTKTIQDHAASTYPDECCGVLLGFAGSEPGIVEAVPVANVDETNPSRRYTIEAGTLLAISRSAARRGLDVVGFYHSHPDHPAQPSAADLHEATFPHYVYVIQSVERGTPTDLTAWSLAEDRSRFLRRQLDPTHEPALSNEPDCQRR